MAKFCVDAAMDAMLNFIADNTKRVTVCSAQPTTYAEGNATYKLAGVDTTEGVGGGDFLLADGDVSGRKLTITQQAAVPITADGTALFIALLDVDNSRLMYVTTCTSQAVTVGGGNTLTIPAFDIEVADPS